MPEMLAALPREYWISFDFGPDPSPTKIGWWQCLRPCPVCGRNLSTNGRRQFRCRCGFHEPAIVQGMEFQNRGRRLKKEEVAFIVESYGILSLKEIAGRVGKTEQCVRLRLKSAGLL